MPRVKNRKSEEQKLKEKEDKKRSDKILKEMEEQKRLNEPIQVFDIRTNQYLYTTTEGRVVKERKGTPGYWYYIANIRELNPESAKYQLYEKYTCSYCKFTNIHKDVVEHHEKYTHMPGHPTSIHANEPEHEKELWAKAHHR